MSKVILDDALRAKLDLHNGTTELCDADGQTVAYVLSAEEYKDLMYAWLKTQYTVEEAERVWNDYLRNGGISTREARARIMAKPGPQEGAA